MRVKPEILAPAGDMEALRAAAVFGADAVYIGGTSFSMRTAPLNFTDAQIAEAAKLLHSSGKKLYVACNVLPRCGEIRQVERFLTAAAQAGADAFIISDLGVFEMAKKAAPDVEIHISTQTGVVNYAAANALFSLGASRVVLARELSLEEIKQISMHTPEALEIEAFVHGSMCVSFSGRCLLSNYLVNRDGNHGECAQPCRWNYALCEESQPGRYFPIYEEDGQTHILNSRDLCMIEHIPELVEAGITSFKIEGRAKSAYYTAAVTNAYRLALDAYFADGDNYIFDEKLLREVDLVSHRDYCTGFYFGPIRNGQDYSGKYERGSDVVAAVMEGGDNLSLIRQRNRFTAGEDIEALEPGKTGSPVAITEIYDSDMRPKDQASEPDMMYFIRTSRPLMTGTMLRRRREQ